MPVVRQPLTVLLLSLLLPLCWARATRPAQDCPSCQGPGAVPGKAAVEGTRTMGESCGVYSSGCAPGLRCVPRFGEGSPLQALLQGRGVCTRVSSPGKDDYATQPQPGGNLPHNNHTLLNTSAEEGTVEKAPCGQHLEAVMQAHKLTVIRHAKDMYIPNCDPRGFYRKKQCRSSKGMRRGVCWCVNESGHPLPGQSRGEASLKCDGE
ncbi:IBP6 protein, partial [Polyodon spathula]|nr:insulin-like growth factor-binding protein 6b [Polyodon spathula]MBN3276307.1 IBP6 protein [Polyodon spathula]